MPRHAPVCTLLGEHNQLGRICIPRFTMRLFMCIGLPPKIHRRARRPASCSSLTPGPWSGRGGSEPQGRWSSADGDAESTRAAYTARKVGRESTRATTGIGNQRHAFPGLLCLRPPRRLQGGTVCVWVTRRAQRWYDLRVVNPWTMLRAMARGARDLRTEH